MIYKTFTNGLEVEARFPDDDIQNIYIPLLRRLTRMQEEKKSRIIVLMAAPPGAGKTTLAAFLSYLSKRTQNVKPLVALGMDGFHYYQDYLDTHQCIRDGKTINLADIKGAPETFNLNKLTEAVDRLYRKENIMWPDYNRLKGNPVEDVYSVEGDIILIEGNYLLLNYSRWKELRNYADYTIMLKADEQVARSRLITRKMRGKTISYQDAVNHVNNSDLYNFRIVENNSATADMIIDFSHTSDFI